MIHFGCVRDTQFTPVIAVIDCEDHRNLSLSPGGNRGRSVAFGVFDCFVPISLNCTGFYRDHRSKTGTGGLNGTFNNIVC